MRTAKIGPDLRLQISAPYTLYPTKGSQQAPVLSYDLHDRHLRTFSLDRFHCHATKNKLETVQWKKPRK